MPSELDKLIIQEEISYSDVLIDLRHGSYNLLANSLGNRRGFLYDQKNYESIVKVNSTQIKAVTDIKSDLIKLPGSDLQLVNTSRLTTRQSIEVDEDDLLAMGEIFRNISLKNLNRSPKPKLPNTSAILSENDTKNLDRSLAFEKMRTQKYHNLVITSGALGFVMILIFVGLWTTTIMSGIVYIHPMVAIGGIITGTTFLAMQLVSSAKRNLK